MTIQNKFSFFGGLLVAISIFLPAISMMGINLSLWQTSSGVAIFYLLCGLGTTFISTLDNKGFYTISFVLNILIFLLSLKYWADAGNLAGTGIYALLIGSILGLYGTWKGRTEATKNE